MTTANELRLEIETILLGKRSRQRIMSNIFAAIMSLPSSMIVFATKQLIKDFGIKKYHDGLYYWSYHVLKQEYLSMGSKSEIESLMHFFQYMMSE